MILKKSGELGQPFLVPSLRRKAVGFSPLVMMLAVDILQMLFIGLKELCFIPTLLIFVISIEFCHVLFFGIY